MALFEPRKADAAPEDRSSLARKRVRAPIDSVEDMRRRARHRLIGACLLVLAAIIAFPMLFDAEPRPEVIDAQVSVDGGDTAPARGRGNQVALVAASGIPNHGLGDDEEVVEDLSPAPDRAAASGAKISDAKATVAPAAVSLAAQRAQQAKQRAQAEQAAARNKPAEKQPPQKPAAKPAETAPKPAEKTAAKPAEKTAKVTEKTAEKSQAKPKAPEKTTSKPTEKPVQKSDKSTQVASAKVPEKAQEKAIEKKPAVADKPAPAAKAPAIQPPPRPAAKDESARARALLEGRQVDTPANRSDQGRFIVQIGAFSDDAKVREVRQKLESLGLRTYTQVVQSGGSRATRVRVGPFANRAEADRAASRVKSANLPAAILSL
ncbi:MAG: SPOR domain-containing protein [Comamonadaceae bacterium]|nr:SPOR domain-containing protein [Comamonadaceae bacterium]